MRFLPLLFLVFLSACAAERVSSILPTSARLEALRAGQEKTLAEELEQQRLALGDPVFIRVFKSEARLEVWMRNRETRRFVPFKSWPICKYSGRLGPKIFEGDFQAPEGFYEVNAEQLNPNSRYHLSFDLGYPNAYDRALGRTGSHLMVHGGCRSEGCFAMTDRGIEDIYLLVEASIAAGNSVPVHVFPFRMTEENMLITYGSPWHGFWRNLKEGYDAFELSNIPPRVLPHGPGQHALKYVFEDSDINHSFEVSEQ